MPAAGVPTVYAYSCKHLIKKRQEAWEELKDVNIKQTRAAIASCHLFSLMWLNKRHGSLFWSESRWCGNISRADVCDTSDGVTRFLLTSRWCSPGLCIRFFPPCAGSRPDVQTCSKRQKNKKKTKHTQWKTTTTNVKINTYLSLLCAPD